MEKENNLDYIADNIFKYPVLPPKTILLDLSDNNNLIELTEILLELCTKGIYILFKKTDFLQLSESEFLTLQIYVNSFGFKIIVKCNYSNDNPWVLLEKDSNTKIENINITFTFF